MKVERHSKNIKNLIIRELSKANREIHIYVAWFTDCDLLNILIKKLISGVSISLVLNDDEINERLNFKEFISFGGKLFKLPNEVFLHDKTCVIDAKTIISGSYNWTYNASNFNLEKVTILYDAEELAEADISEYRKLINLYFPKGLSNKLISDNKQNLTHTILTETFNVPERITSLFLNKENLLVDLISENYPFSISELKKHKHMINWKVLSTNKYVHWSMEILNEFADELFWGITVDIPPIDWDDFWSHEYIKGISDNPSIPWTEELIYLNEERIQWHSFEMNYGLPWTYDFIRKHQDKLNFYKMSSSEVIPWSFDLLLRYKDKWDWDSMSNNMSIPWTDDLIDFFKDKLEWNALSVNGSLPWSIDFINKYFGHWNWKILSANPNLPWSQDLLDAFSDKWDWDNLSGNSGLGWTEEFINRYDENLLWGAFSQFRWGGTNYFISPGLSYNPSVPWSEDFIDKNIKRLNWSALCQNKGIPWTLEFIKKYWDYILKNNCIYYLSENPYLPWNEKIIEDLKPYLDKKRITQNYGIAWSIDILEKHNDLIDWENLKENKAIYKSAFSPYINKDSLDIFFTIK